MAERWVGRLLLAAALLAGGARAASLWWTTDDAFISFRYARNLVEGLGLVFNAGERVEGFTNLLWTLWVALGLRFGLDAEAWANAWGIVAYLATIALAGLAPLALARDRGEARPRLLPLAALGAALHEDWAVYATGGLETSAFTFLLTAGFCLVWAAHGRPRGAAPAGLVMALAALTRPDGLLPAALLGVWLASRGRWRRAAVYAGVFALIWLPANLWRASYYGDFLPNTYYAKSAGLAWWTQGWRYVGLYYERYGVLLLAPLALLAALGLGRSRQRRAPAESGASSIEAAAAALAVATAYTLYVARVGGDFMYARLLIPTAPLLLLALELGWDRLFGGRRALATAFGAVALVALALTPHPLPDTEWRHGVANERRYYTPTYVAELDHSAEVLGRALGGLPVRVAFYGDEARLVYRARIPLAIESHAGLTDREVAHQPLAARGRVGHEKHASASYLIEERRAHFTFSVMAQRLLHLDREIPEIRVPFDREVWGQVLHWDPALMAALRARGVAVPDFEAMLDRYIARLPRTPDDEVARAYQRLRRFYFTHVADPAREDAFRRRLAGGSAQGE